MDIDYFIIKESVQNNNIDYLKTKKTTDWNQVLFECCSQNNKYLMEQAVKMGANNWEWGLYGSAISGNRRLVDICLNKGAKDFNTAICFASKHGHLKLVKLFVNLGATSFKMAFKNACTVGHIGITRFLILKMVPDFYELYQIAFFHDSEEVKKQIIKMSGWPNRDWLLLARQYGDILIFQDLAFKFIN